MMNRDSQRERDRDRDRDCDCDRNRRHDRNCAGMFGKIKKKVCILLVCGAAAVILFAVLSRNTNESAFSEKIADAITDVVEGEEGKVFTVTRTSIVKVFEISELSTADYMYNAIAKAYAEDGSSIKYYVAYEGNVKAGIDFSKIKIEINEETKTISLLLPDIEFKERTVNPGTLEYIFKDKKSETETVHQEAFQICEKDLAERIDREEALLALAKENAAAVVKALVTPWVEQIDSEYTVEIK